MTIDQLPTSLDPKGFPVEYFSRYQTPQGMDTIWVFYRKHEWHNGEYCPVEGTDFKKKVEVITFLNQGMPSGFYRIGFDYALSRNGDVKSLIFAYEGLDGREHGVFGRHPESYEWNKKHLWLL
jgi:hypothetical protein